MNNYKLVIVFSCLIIYILPKINYEMKKKFKRDLFAISIGFPSLEGNDDKMVHTPFILVVTSLAQSTYSLLRGTQHGKDLAGATHTDSPGTSPGRERNGNFNNIHIYIQGQKSDCGGGGKNWILGGGQK